MFFLLTICPCLVFCISPCPRPCPGLGPGTGPGPMIFRVLGPSPGSVKFQVQALVLVPSPGPVKFRVPALVPDIMAFIKLHAKFQLPSLIIVNVTAGVVISRVALMLPPWVGDFVFALKFFKKIL